jgi:hypothetical protein
MLSRQTGCDKKQVADQRKHTAGLCGPGWLRRPVSGHENIQTQKKASEIHSSRAFNTFDPNRRTRLVSDSIFMKTILPLNQNKADARWIQDRTDLGKSDGAPAFFIFSASRIHCGKRAL